MPTSAHRPVTRFGLQINSFTWPDIPDSELFSRTAEIARTAERSGFDSVWVMDHFYQIRVNGQDGADARGLHPASGIAARTEHVSLGGMVTGVTYRNPALLAKTVTTLDIDLAGPRDPRHRSRLERRRARRLRVRVPAVEGAVRAAGGCAPDLR